MPKGSIQLMLQILQSVFILLPFGFQGIKKTKRFQKEIFALTGSASYVLATHIRPYDMLFCLIMFVCQWIFLYLTFEAEELQKNVVVRHKTSLHIYYVYQKHIVLKMRSQMSVSFALNVKLKLLIIVTPLSIVTSESNCSDGINYRSNLDIEYFMLYPWTQLFYHVYTIHSYILQCPIAINELKYFEKKLY